MSDLTLEQQMDAAYARTVEELWDGDLESITRAVAEFYALRERFLEQDRAEFEARLKEQFKERRDA